MKLLLHENLSFRLVAQLPPDFPHNQHVDLLRPPLMEAFVRDLKRAF